MKTKGHIQRHAFALALPRRSKTNLLSPFKACSHTPAHIVIGSLFQNRLENTPFGLGRSGFAHKGRIEWVGCQVLVAVLGDQHLIFQFDREAAALFAHQSLDAEHHARLKRVVE